MHWKSSQIRRNTKREFFALKSSLTIVEKFDWVFPWIPCGVFNPMLLSLISLSGLYYCCARYDSRMYLGRIKAQTPDVGFHHMWHSSGESMNALSALLFVRWRDCDLSSFRNCSSLCPHESQGGYHLASRVPDLFWELIKRANVYSALTEPEGRVQLMVGPIIILNSDNCWGSYCQYHPEFASGKTEAYGDSSARSRPRGPAGQGPRFKSTERALQPLTPIPCCGYVFSPFPLQLTELETSGFGRWDS